MYVTKIWIMAIGFLSIGNRSWIKFLISQYIYIYIYIYIIVKYFFSFYVMQIEAYYAPLPNYM